MSEMTVRHATVTYVSTADAGVRAVIADQPSPIAHTTSSSMASTITVVSIANAGASERK